MKDAQNLNGGGKVFGFITSGKQWRIIVYNGTQFQQSEGVDILFANMSSEEDRWMETGSVIVDMVFTALKTGGNGLQKN